MLPTSCPLSWPQAQRTRAGTVAAANSPSAGAALQNGAFGYDPECLFGAEILRVGTGNPALLHASSNSICPEDKQTKERLGINMTHASDKIAQRQGCSG